MEKFIIISVVIHAYAFAFMFFSKKQLSARILGFYMLSFFIQGFLFANFHIFKIENLNILFYLLISALSLCDFPLIYLYVKVMSEEKYKLSYRSFFNFIPAFVFLIAQLICFITLDSSEKLLLFQPKEVAYNHPDLQNFFTIYSLSIMLIFAQVFYYSSLMIYKLVKHRYNIEKHYSFKDKITLNWLFIFVVLYLLYYIFEITIFLFRFIEITETEYFSVVSLHIFFVGFFGLKQRDIYLKKQQEKPKNDEFIDSDLVSMEAKMDNLNHDVVTDNVEVSKRQSLLSDDLKREIANKIEFTMKEKQLFLNPELSLDDMALELQIHKNYISHVINDMFDKNFYTYINLYRIEAAKKMLSDKKYNLLSIEGIAKTCGYKSRNVFYPIFKKFEGVTPLEYKNKVQGLSINQD